MNTFPGILLCLRMVAIRSSANRRVNAQDAANQGGDLMDPTEPRPTFTEATLILRINEATTDAERLALIRAHVGHEMDLALRREAALRAMLPES